MGAGWAGAALAGAVLLAGLGADWAGAVLLAAFFSSGFAGAV